MGTWPGFSLPSSQNFQILLKPDIPTNPPSLSMTHASYATGRDRSRCTGSGSPALSSSLELMIPNLAVGKRDLPAFENEIASKNEPSFEFRRGLRHKKGNSPPPNEWIFFCTPVHPLTLFGWCKPTRIGDGPDWTALGRLKAAGGPQRWGGWGCAGTRSVCQPQICSASPQFPGHRSATCAGG